MFMIMITTIMSLMGTKPERTLGWRNFMPENFPKLNRYFALTAYCNTIFDWPIEQSLFHIRVFFGGKMKSSCFLHALFIHWLIKQITNTFPNHFSRSYENHSSVIMMYVYDMANVKYKWKEVSVVRFPSLTTIPCLTETRPVLHLF